jgi:hypothetical protein
MRLAQKGPRFDVVDRGSVNALRLAMIRPPVLAGAFQRRIDAARPTPSNQTIELSTDRVVSAHLAVALGPNDHHLR